MVTFDASDSYDLDGDALNYSWSFGANTITTTKLYSESGVYTETVTVDDVFYLTSTASISVTVQVNPPTITIIITST